MLRVQGASDEITCLGESSMGGCLQWRGSYQVQAFEHAATAVQFEATCVMLAYEIPKSACLTDTQARITQSAIVMSVPLLLAFQTPFLSDLVSHAHVHTFSLACRTGLQLFARLEHLSPSTCRHHDELDRYSQLNYVCPLFARKFPGDTAQVL